MVASLRPKWNISPKTYMGWAAIQVVVFQHHGTCPSKLLFLHIGHISEQKGYVCPIRQMKGCSRVWKLIPWIESIPTFFLSYNFHLQFTIQTLQFTFTFHKRPGPASPGEIRIVWSLGRVQLFRFNFISACLIFLINSNSLWLVKDHRLLSLHQDFALAPEY